MSAERVSVSGGQLVDRMKELVHEGNVRCALPATARLSTDLRLLHQGKSERVVRQEVRGNRMR